MAEAVSNPPPVRRQRTRLRIIDCAVCKRPFKPAKATIECCSAACGAILCSRRRSSRIAIENARECSQCKGSFVAKEHDQRFCSKRCVGLAIGERRHAEAKLRRGISLPSPPRVALCKVCLATFRPKNGNHVVCSDSCRETLYRIRTGRHLSTLKCKGCGNEFTQDHGLQSYCSKLCYKECYRKRLGGSKNRHRARRFGVHYQPINVVWVFERDGWRCQICGIKTPKRYRGKLRETAPELDHRVPIAMGGDHTYENVQCACRSCNRAKAGTAVRGQLPLFAVPVAA
jgi:hypothetical protein